MCLCILCFIDVVHLIGSEHLYSIIYFPLKKGDNPIFISHDFIKKEAEKTKYAENTRIFKMKQNAQSNTGLILIFGFLMSKVGVVRKR